MRNLQFGNSESALGRGPVKAVRYLLANHFIEGSESDRSWTWAKEREARINRLVANRILSRDQWEDISRESVKVQAQVLNGILDLQAAGLTRDVSIGKTIHTYETLSDVAAPAVGIDPQRRVRSAADRTPYQVPIPAVWGDYSFGARTMAASNSIGESLDTTTPDLWVRRIAETQEDHLFNGGFQAAGAVMYGYTNHPDKIDFTFDDATAWTHANHSGEDMLGDVLKGIGQGEAEGFYGRWNLYLPPTWMRETRGDFKANSDKSILQRLLEIDSLNAVKSTDRLAGQDKLVLVQMTKDVVELVVGMPITPMSWMIEGDWEEVGMIVGIQAPVVKRAPTQKSGNQKTGIVVGTPS
jgi:hypothetical protein